MHQYPGFAAAGAGQYQRGSQRRANGLPLIVVESVEKMRYVHKGADSTVACVPRSSSRSGGGRAAFLGEFDQGKRQGKYHRPGNDADRAERRDAAQHADEHGQRRNPRPTGNEYGTQNIIQTGPQQSPRQHEYAIAPAAIDEQPDRGGTPDERRSAHRQHGEQPGQYPEHHRGGQTGNLEPDAYQHSLQYGGHAGSDDNGARDAAQLPEQSSLALFVKGNEPARAGHHGITVAQEQEH